MYVGQGLTFNAVYQHCDALARITTGYNTRAVTTFSVVTEFKVQNIII